MNQVPFAESLAQGTKFERFLILNKKKLMLASFLVAFVITAVSMPPSGPLRQGPESKRMQLSRQIDLMMFAYSSDHNGHYPQGKSSTEIFQLLLDQKYTSDPAAFYFPMTGKNPATTDKLKPENVCFDVTDGVLPDDPDDLPVVFSTGYKIDYALGGKAHLLANGDPNGIAVAFKSNSAAFLRAQGEGISLIYPAYVPNGVPSNFNPKGRTYRQLTPDGSLP